MKCPECKGSGKYVGLNTVEPCAACGGRGKAPTLIESGFSATIGLVGEHKAGVSVTGLGVGSDRPVYVSHVDMDTVQSGYTYRITCEGVELDKCTAADAVEGWAEVLDMAAYMPGMDEVPRKRMRGKVMIERVTEAELVQPIPCSAADQWWAHAIANGDALSDVAAWFGLPERLLQGRKAEEPLRVSTEQKETRIVMESVGCLPLKLPATFVRMVDESHLLNGHRPPHSLNSKPWRGHASMTAFVIDVRCDRQEDGRWRMQTRVVAMPWTGEPRLIGIAGEVPMTEEQWREKAYNQADFNEYDFGELVPEQATVSEPHFKPVSLDAKPWRIEMSDEQAAAWVDMKDFSECRQYDPATGEYRIISYGCPE